MFASVDILMRLRRVLVNRRQTSDVFWLLLVARQTNVKGRFGRVVKRRCTEIRESVGGGEAASCTTGILGVGW